MRLLHLAPLLSLPLAGSAASQDLAFELTADSQSALVSGFTVDLPGSLIGDFDRTSNPGGTRTVPGVFGGPGNEPVDANFGLAGTGNLIGTPTGGFDLSVDLGAGTLQLDGLDVDLLGGTTGTNDLSLLLQFETFVTYNPDSLYFDIPLDIPLGSQEVREVRLTQVAPSTEGTITGGSGSYTFSALVPASLSFVVVVGELETPVGPLPLLGVRP